MEILLAGTNLVFNRYDDNSINKLLAHQGKGRMLVAGSAILVNITLTPGR
jgi:hypothetical protein